MRYTPRGSNGLGVRAVSTVLGGLLATVFATAFVMVPATVLSSCQDEDGADARRPVSDPPMPADTRWAPSDPRAPRTVLEKALPTGSWKLTVELPRGHEAQGIVVFGPAPAFDEIAKRDLARDDTTTKFEFALAPTMIPNTASELYVAVRYADVTLAVGQALIR